MPEGYVNNERNKKNINYKNRPKYKSPDKTNPPPLTMSCASSADEGPTVDIHLRENNRTITCADNK
jgi:hypothetical protein